ncbi:RNA polymerase II transcription elongation factor-domain-containing protein [Myxozyma melibiosi]|uniref:RNA polymerase II transcription elongation factor-domain-containing protein n=1 Tax=Myxozyma melibiosi TaxID=54550 RepID=A0ABR1F2P1_9ASCO
MIDPSKNGEYPITVSRSFAEPASSDQLFALRYNFKPESVDDSQPSVLTRSGSEFTLRSPGIQEESFTFTGQSTEGKDVDCLLIYNEVTNSFELKRLSNVIRLKTSRSAPKKPSATSANSSASSSSTSPTKEPIVRRSKDERVIDLPSLDDLPASSSDQTSAVPRAQVRVPSPSVQKDDRTPSGRAQARKHGDADLSSSASSDEDDDVPLRASTSSQPLRQPISAKARFAAAEVEEPESSSDEDEDDAPRSQPQSQPQPARQPRQPPAIPQVRAPVPIPVSSRGPISLRGYTGYGRVEDDISSSSEEE